MIWVEGVARFKETVGLLIIRWVESVATAKQTIVSIENEMS
jgi:hypothetical protein